MIIDAWYATAGVVAYAVWSAICVMLAGLALNGYQTDRRVMWLRYDLSWLPGVAGNG